MYGAEAFQEAAFATGLLEARGDLDPNGPEAEAIVKATLKDVITHEVGHTLGLRHNFRASTIYTEKQLSDPEFTRKNGLGGSVMDYNAWNLPLANEKQGEYVMSTLGPYDYWAIEYAYKPIAASKAAELAKIAARSNEPYLAFATDEETPADGMDPAGEPARPGQRSAPLRQAPHAAVARALGPLAGQAPQARREPRGALPQRGVGLHPVRARGAGRGQVRGRRGLRARLRGQHAGLVHAGGARAPARGAQARDRRPLPGRQLPLQAGVPHAPRGRPVRGGGASPPTSRSPRACSRCRSRSSTAS